MDSQQVSSEYMKAGADYLAALKKLGLHPTFLGWGREVNTEQWVLVMVTSIIDAAGGPLALNTLLFKAYNAEATPRAISPFIVRVYSPDAFASDLLRSRPTSIANLTLTFHGIMYQMINTYALPSKGKRLKPNYHAKLNEWQKFKRNVERLAA